MHDDNDTGFPRLSAPAGGTLERELQPLAETSESDLKRLHDIGPTAVSALRPALRERGLSVRD